MRHVYIPLYIIEVWIKIKLLFFLTALSLMLSCTSAKRVFIKQNLSLAEQLISIEEPITYIISTHIDLKGTTVSIPNKSTLLFVREGLIENGSIEFNDVTIKNKTRHSVFKDCLFSGHLSNKKLNISSFGVKADGKNDDSQIINNVLEIIEGEGCELLFDCDGDYGVSSPNRRNTITIGSNTIVTFSGKGFLKLLCTSKGGAVLSLKEKAHDIVINNIRIDGGGESIIVGNSGQNGIGAGNFLNFKVNGGIIRNCCKGQDVCINGAVLLGDGGKGIQIESFNCQNGIFNNIQIENCHAAISCHRNLAIEGGINVLFSNIYGYNCEQFAIIHQTNGEDLVGNEQNVCIKSFVAHNCGNPDGVFIFSRTRHLKIEKGRIEGDFVTPAIFRGRIAKSVARDITITQPCKAIIDLNPSPYGQDIRASYLNYFDLKVSSYFDYVVNTDDNKQYPYRSLTKSLISITSDKDPSVAIYKKEVASSGELNLNLNLSNNKHFEGTSAAFGEVYGADYNNLQKEYSDNKKTSGNKIMRPKNLTKNDKGFVFWNTNLSVLEIWDGDNWVEP